MCCDITLCTGACVGQDSVVGIATCYGLDNLGIESQWGGGGGSKIFRTHPDRS